MATVTLTITTEAKEEDLGTPARDATAAEVLNAVQDNLAYYARDFDVPWRLVRVERVP